MVIVVEAVHVAPASGNETPTSRKESADNLVVRGESRTITSVASVGSMIRRNSLVARESHEKVVIAEDILSTILSMMHKIINKQADTEEIDQKELLSMIIYLQKPRKLVSRLTTQKMMKEEAKHRLDGLQSQDSAVSSWISNVMNVRVGDNEPNPKNIKFRNNEYKKENEKDKEKKDKSSKLKPNVQIIPPQQSQKKKKANNKEYKPKQTCFKRRRRFIFERNPSKNKSNITKRTFSNGGNIKTGITIYETSLRRNKMVNEFTHFAFSALASIHDQHRQSLRHAYVCQNATSLNYTQQTHPLQTEQTSIPTNTYISTLTEPQYLTLYTPQPHTCTTTHTPHLPEPRNQLEHTPTNTRHPDTADFEPTSINPIQRYLSLKIYYPII